MESNLNVKEAIKAANRVLNKGKRTRLHLREPQKQALREHMRTYWAKWRGGREGYSRAASTDLGFRVTKGHIDGLCRGGEFPTIRHRNGDGKPLTTRQVRARTKADPANLIMAIRTICGMRPNEWTSKVILTLLG
jgi:hypothetical protein